MEKTNRKTIFIALALIIIFTLTTSLSLFAIQGIGAEELTSTDAEIELVDSSKAADEAYQELAESYEIILRGETIDCEVTPEEAVEVAVNEIYRIEGAQCTGKFYVRQSYYVEGNDSEIGPMQWGIIAETDKGLYDCNIHATNAKLLYLDTSCWSGLTTIEETGLLDEEPMSLEEQKQIFLDNKALYEIDENKEAYIIKAQGWKDVIDECRGSYEEQVAKNFVSEKCLPDGVSIVDAYIFCLSADSYAQSTFCEVQVELDNGEYIVVVIDQSGEYMTQYGVMWCEWHTMHCLEYMYGRYAYEAVMGS